MWEGSVWKPVKEYVLFNGCTTHAVREPDMMEYDVRARHSDAYIITPVY